MAGSVGHGLRLLEGRFAVCRLASDDMLPARTAEVDFLSVTRTAEEVSVVCLESQAPAGRIETGWRCLEVQGPLPFDQVGVLASLAQPLADAGVSIFAISTFDTDYLLIKEAQLEEALASLRDAGHRVS